MPIEKEDEELIRDLLKRAGVSHDHAFNVLGPDDLIVAIETVVSMLGAESPDVKWWPDYYKTTGEEMVLTEEGWIPPECAEGMEILDSVNCEGANAS